MSDDHAVQVLREVLQRLRSQPWERDHWDSERLEAARVEALERYGWILSPKHIHKLDRETFLAFLHSENKWHRMGLGRVGSMTADMASLREAIGLLVDEQIPLKTRLDRLRPHGGKPLVDGLGPGIITVILHFVDPVRYGILSGASDRVMRRFGLYPDLPVTASLSDRYEAINPILIRLAAALEIDLGLLDSLWWRVQPQSLAAYAMAEQGAN